MSASERALLEVAQTQAEPSEGSSDGGHADPQRVGHYVILRRLGEGSMGVVYAAYDTELDRKVAIKLVRNHRLEQSQSRARVIREAQAMAQISHPNVVHVYEVGESQDGDAEDASGGRVFIAMEFVAGMDLYRWQSQEKRAFPAILQMYIQAGEGLWAAHCSNLIHRDFKPDNVLVGDDGRARVADFGLARSMRGAEPDLEMGSNDYHHNSPLHGRITETGAIVGTPSYMSPEQHRGAEVDASSDQYSYCAALYEALFGQVPVAGESRAQIAESALEGKVRAPPEIELPLGLVQALSRGLSVEPAARFPSMLDLLAELRIAMNPIVDSPASRRARRLVSWVIGAAIVASSVPGLLADVPPPVEHVLALPVIILVIMLVITAANYKRMVQSPEHWGLLLLLYLFLVQAALARILAVVSGLTLFQYLPIDHVIFFGFAAVVAYRYIPKMWIGALLIAVSGTLTAASPALFWKSAVIVYPIVGVLYFMWWPKRAQADRPARGMAASPQPASDTPSVAAPAVGSSR